MKEWNQVGDEYSGGQEWENVPEQYADLATEYSQLPKEYAEPPKEYELWQGEEAERDKQRVRGRSRKKRLLKKMSYMVAATISVVVMGKTIEMEPENTKTDILEESVSSQEQGTNELFWPNVPESEGFFGETPENSLAEGNKEAPLLIYTGDFESYGWGNGGVIPVKKEGLWGLIDYEGNEVLAPAYEGFWLSPNDDGYTIFNDADGYYIAGADGSVREYGPEVSGLRIGEENIVSYTLYLEEGEIRYRYERLDGTVLHELESVSEDYFASASAFHEGKAYAYCVVPDGTEWGNPQLIELSLDGTSRVVMDENELEEIARAEHEQQESIVSQGGVIVNSTNGGSGISVPVYAPCDGYEKGFFVGNAPGYGGGWCLIEPDAERSFGLMTSITFEDKNLEHYDNFRLKSYRSNGVDMLHHILYGCMTVTTEDGQSKDYLFDYSYCIGEELISYLACYDTIVLDNLNVLLAKEGDEYFYITPEGGTWMFTENYYKATSFNDACYAMVMKEDGMAELIYMDCVAEMEFKGVSNVAICDQVFEITFTEENEWGLEPGTYLYTEYSPK